MPDSRYPTLIPKVLDEREKVLLAQWMQAQLEANTLRPDLLKESDLREQSRQFLSLLRHATEGNVVTDVTRPHWATVRDFLAQLSRSRALQGFSPSETATFVFSLKQPLFEALRQAHGEAGDALFEDLWRATVLLDALGLRTSESYQQAREEIISRQQNEMFELSSPVVELWKGVLGLPLIGTLDSRRSQLVTESLLRRLAETQADIAVIDITGVPTIDTMSAQHLLKTVGAARLMGAECIISGVRPQIAQTMVQLGVNLADVPTRATLASALALAFKRIGLAVQPVARPAGN